MQCSLSVLFLSAQFAITPWKTKKANEFQMWHELLICRFMQIKHIWGKILFTLVSKNTIVPVIQQVQTQSLQMGQLIDFREESPRLSVGEGNNELVPVHIPDHPGLQFYSHLLFLFL